MRSILRARIEYVFGAQQSAPGGRFAKAGGYALPLVVDVRDETQVKSAIERTVATFGGKVSLRRVSRGTEHPGCSRQDFGIHSALAGRRDTIIEAADGSDTPRPTSNALLWKKAAPARPELSSALGLSFMPNPFYFIR